MEINCLIDAKTKANIAEVMEEIIKKLKKFKDASSQEDFCQKATNCENAVDLETQAKSDYQIHITELSSTIKPLKASLQDLLHNYDEVETNSKATEKGLVRLLEERDIEINNLKDELKHSNELLQKSEDELLEYDKTQISATGALSSIKKKLRLTITEMCAELVQSNMSIIKKEIIQLEIQLNIVLKELEDNTQHQKAKFENQLLSLQEKNRDLTSKHEKQQIKNNILRAEVKCWRTRANALTECSNKNSKEIKRIQNELESLAIMVIAEKENIKLVNEKIAILLNDKQCLEDDLNNVNNKLCIFIQEEKRKSDNEHDNLKSTVSRHTKELLETKTLLYEKEHELKKTTGQLSTTNNSLLELRNQLQKIHQIADSYKDRYMTLKSEMDSRAIVIAKTIKEHLEIDYQSEIAIKGEKEQFLSNKIYDLKKNLSLKVRTKNEAIKQADEELRLNKNHLNTCKKRNVKLSNIKLLMETKIVRLEKELNKNTKEIKELKEHIEKLNDENETIMLHNRSLSGKPYECTVCEKKFANKSTLTIHTRKHTGEMPYKCEKCNMTFSNLTHLNNHKRFWHADKKSYCLVCKNIYVTQQPKQQSLLRPRQQQQLQSLLKPRQQQQQQSQLSQQQTVAFVSPKFKNCTGSGSSVGSLSQHMVVRQLQTVNTIQNQTPSTSGKSSASSSSPSRNIVITMNTDHQPSPNNTVTITQAGGLKRKCDAAGDSNGKKFKEIYLK